eukprot:10521183-Karenia_brevis.AAC.1
MAAEPATLAGLFHNNNVPEAILTSLAGSPWRITSIHQFANYFDDRQAVQRLFCDQKQDIFKDRGDLVANLKQPWREADALVPKGLKRTADDVDLEDIEAPLRFDEAEKLETAFQRHYHFSLPAAWQAFPSVLGLFHREFKRRSP